uniref:G_PROTEIN_RECEP_F1_2 domain-containing protein n=1 Tax=Caenorhabditis tropicalis TaxID=1561998 RepID=A0A1I7UW16_9PELO
MIEEQSFNWTLIRGTCPEFIPNHWDIVLAVFAVVGAVMNCILMFRFKKTMRGSVFLNTLAGCDFGCCILYLYNYFFTSAAVYYRNNLMAFLRIMTHCEMKMVKDFYDIILPLLVFHIIFEKFLWTCSTRTRLKWTFFTLANYKFLLTVMTTVYAGMATFISNWNFLVSSASLQ